MANDFTTDLTDVMYEKATEERLTCLLSMKKKMEKSSAFKSDIIETQEQTQAVIAVYDAISGAIAIEAKYVGGNR